MTLRNSCDTNLMRCGCDKASVIWISLETIRCVLLSSFPLSIILTATRSVIKRRNWSRWCGSDGFLMVRRTWEAIVWFDKFIWHQKIMRCNYRLTWKRKRSSTINDSIKVLHLLFPKGIFYTVNFVLFGKAIPDCILVISVVIAFSINGTVYSK